MKPLVVKLGGSTAGKAEMQHWIDALATSTFPLVIVPGGGPFADQVRLAQKRFGISDDAAHAMAILAMDQFGVMLAERHDRLRLARTVGEIDYVLAAGHFPVWLPSTMTIDAAHIQRSWNVTSDSLSAWLAEKLGAKALLLIKQTDEYLHCASLSALAHAAIVDPMLDKMLASDIDLHIAGPQTLAALKLPLATIPGHPIMRWSIAEDMGAQ
ncbi:dihydroneopterin aldolase [Phyllobacterium sp. YR620]|uniref:amino acid kinase family protein n=1 Tax=Phyllobacterium sp. YR620 TaxID=1881066 RepID=UPI00089260B8|nr:hypothetical protein [Phyllobacterium sp. YR620]SDP90812.1 dihydroneopterin aldolase [Phyllobacterium sp. YR620]